MKRRWIVATLAVGALAGCMAAGPQLAAQSSSEHGSPASPLGSPFSAEASSPKRSWPLILDRTDMSLGTAVHYDRIPTVGEIHDLDLVTGFQHLVLSLPGWPSGVSVIEPLNQVPEGTDVIAILPGYPPSREAADAWNQIAARVRIVVIVDGPPMIAGVADDLNLMRGLERVIAQMERPSRSGFERLQRPISFRKIVE